MRAVIRTGILVFCLSPGTLWPQSGVSGARADSIPAAYEQALELLAAGDTLGALDLLRVSTSAAPEFGPAWLRLGAVLTARAGEILTEFRERLEARRALDRAWRLMPDDPEVLLEYGILLGKQGVGTDTRRVLERALATAERKGQDLSLAQLARIHYTLGRIYEDAWEAWKGLILIPPAAVGWMSCAESPQPSGFSGFAVGCPRHWREVLSGVVRLEDLKEDERQRMIMHFRLALEADPGHVDAGVRLLGHLADAGDWISYGVFARRLVLTAPDDPRPHLFLGLWLHRRGHDAQGQESFSQALRLMPAPDHRAFRDVGALLPSTMRETYAELDSAGRAEAARVLFAAKEPMYLTPVNERELEHYARVAWADLKLSAPASGLRGWEVEPGEIHIRYGTPELQVQCCYGAGRSATAVRGGRTQVWSYGPDGPNFAFERQRGYRRGRMTGATAARVDDLTRVVPEMYQPFTITSVHDMPHQLVRFRGDEPGLTRFEIYAAPPTDSLDAARGDSLEAGVFVFDEVWRRVWERRHGARLGTQPLGLTYLFQIPAGAYRYALEARRAGPDSLPRRLARMRGRVDARAFPPGRLALSDVLLAERIEPRATGPSRRADLRIVPKRSTMLRAGEPIHIYFELYGLTPGASGAAHYRVEMMVADSTRRNFVERLARGGRQLFRRTERDVRVSWERTATVHDDVAIDYLTADVGTLRPGEYVMSLSVTDLMTGEVARAERRFEVSSPRE